MSVISAAIELQLPAEPAVTGRRNKTVAVIRSLVGHRRPSQEPPYLHIGSPYLIPGSRGARRRGQTWVHTSQ